MRALLVLLLLLFLACHKPEQVTPDAGAAAPSAAASAASYRARWLDLKEAQTDAIALAGGDCDSMAGALRAFDLSDQGQQLEALEKQKDPEGNVPFTGRDKERFDRIKRVLVNVLQRCSDDPDFMQAYAAGAPSDRPPPHSSTDWVAYRDPDGRFDATFMAAPEAGKRNGPHSVTTAATLTWEQGFQAAAIYELQAPDSYDCALAIDADLSNFTSRCSVKWTRAVSADGLSGREIVVECPDATIGLRRVTCDSRKPKKRVYLFDVQSLYASDAWNETEARRFVDGCHVHRDSF